MSKPKIVKRYNTVSGVAVTVTEEKAQRLGKEWSDEAPKPAAKSQRKPAAKKPAADSGDDKN